VIVPDGRTDLEKLKELLGNPEQTHPDLKAKVDFSNAADKLKLFKDSVTMASRPEGGVFMNSAPGFGLGENGLWLWLSRPAAPSHSRFPGAVWPWQ
jgi:hypothetical protein